MKIAKNITVSGKRKSAIAKATIRNGTGNVTVNKVPYEQLDFFRKLTIKEPIEIAKKVLGKFDFDIVVNVKGGGTQGQISAARLAIGKALVQLDIKLKKIFLAYDRNLLVADVRFKETRKPNKSKARAKRQKSYR